MEPRRGDKLAWIVALIAAAIVVVVAMMNGDALERLFSSPGGVSPTSPSAGSGDAGRQEMR